jgi:hypothetical protein
VVTKDINSAWWLGLVAGILEIFLGFWASQQFLSVRGALLLVWVGLFAVFRGISEIVIAFELRHAQRPSLGAGAGRGLRERPCQERHCSPEPAHAYPGKREPCLMILPGFAGPSYRAGLSKT